MHDDVSYKCFIKATLRYAVHDFYIMSDSEYSEEAYARNKYLECVLIFESQEEKEAFNCFAKENIEMKISREYRSCSLISEK